MSEKKKAGLKWQGKLGIGVLGLLMAFYMSVAYMYDDSTLLEIVIIGLYIFSLMMILAGLLGLFRKIFKQEE